MTESSNNFSINDEPTRELSSRDESYGFDLSPKPTPGAIPRHIGDYQIIELIGSGGMGQVYLAEHTRMQRLVALKMLPVERMEDPDAIMRFYDEVRAASRLMHPNIVTAFDASEANGIHYLAMEYVDGPTFAKLVSRDGPLSVGAAAATIRQAALGLLHAHRAGIIHRDVKPGNLMRSSDGTVKVLDLGLARMSSASLLTETSRKSVAELDDPVKSRGRLIGTLPYMSPEQLEDPDSVDARSDIYSLGATLYFLLVGRPPFTGEYLDQVYGHRHGDIPDLMHVRDDVDVHLANIFARMLAKKPKERYTSLDEVVDDLSEYASNTETPRWLAEFTQRSTSIDLSTLSGGSTCGASAQVLAIDFGMFYSVAAESLPNDSIRVLSAGGDHNALFRMALASNEDGTVAYGVRALEQRGTHPQRLIHCLPIYIGKPLVDREIAGRKCPPEVLLALLFQQIRLNAWPRISLPQATAITVPSSYDQLHRRSIMLAARMAGFASVRLVDRSLAAVQSLFMDSDVDSSLSEMAEVDRDQDKTILFVGLTGQASEVAIIRRDSYRLHQLSTAGHWHTGSLRWLQRLVDLTAKRFINTHRFDPRKSIHSAANLQMACEKALNSMLLLREVRITLVQGNAVRTVMIQRDHWLRECADLITDLRNSITDATSRAGIHLDQIQTCVTLGSLLRVDSIRDAVLRDLNPNCVIQPTDRTEVARGAAACLTAELPGRGALKMPPRGVSSQSIGILVEDTRKRRRILRIIPKGTSLPARINRRLRIDRQRNAMTLSVVESSGVSGDEWQTLGRYDFEIEDPAIRSRMISFEINMNGLLQMRAQSVGAPGSIKLPSLPESPLSEEAIAEWTAWVERLR